MALSGRLKLAVVIASGVFVAIMLNSPIPDGFEEPWKLRLHLVPLRFTRLVIYPSVKHIYGTEASIRTWRQIVDSKVQPVPPGIETRDLDFEGVPVRLFVPEGGANSTAALIFMHGGGWTMASVDTYVEFCSWLTSVTGMTVVSIGYRLAPEHLYPAAFQDCEVATRYFLKNAHTFGVDPNRVAVIGDSAGGNLAAAVALRLRDVKFTPTLKMQVLIYPALQAIDLRLPSYNEDSCPVLKSDFMVSFWLLYAIGEDTITDQLLANNHTPTHIKRKYAEVIDRALLPSAMTEGHDKAPMHDGDHGLWGRLSRVLQDPYFSPGVATDLRDLPRTFMLTAGNDPLRDEGMIYASRLQKAGNRIKHVHHASGIHGLISLAQFEECKTKRKEVVRYILNHL